MKEEKIAFLNKTLHVYAIESTSTLKNNALKTTRIIAA